jgi:fumarate hydratase class II
LSPRIGYERAAELAKEAISSGRTIREQMIESGEFSGEEVDRLLDARAMTDPEGE